MQTNRPRLLLTNDCGDIVACGSMDALDRVADAMIAARPDLQAIDAADGDLCYFQGAEGHFWHGGVDTPGPYAALVAAGMDPLGHVFTRVRAAGIPVLANFRMNDHHGGENMWTPWQRAHAEWSLGTDTGTRDWRAVGDLRQMDYAVADVRARHLAILEEVLTRYNLDGLQLDFGRTTPFLSEPKREHAPLMTAFVRDVRALLARVAAAKGHRAPMLGAILPWDLNFCAREGLDVEQWIRDGLLDYASPGEWHYSDWNMPVHRWAEVTRGTTCLLLPLAMGSVSGAPDSGFERNLTLLRDNVRLDGPKVRALAETYFRQGADGINFFNVWVDTPGYAALRDWTTPATIHAESRHYCFFRNLSYVPTEHYAFSTDQARWRVRLRQEGATAVTTFRFGAELHGRQAALRFKTLEASAGDIAVSLNDTPLGPPRNVTTPDLARSHLRLWEYAVGAPALRCGENTIAFTLRHARECGAEVSELEILVPPTGHSA